MKTITVPTTASEMELDLALMNLTNRSIKAKRYHNAHKRTIRNKRTVFRKGITTLLLVAAASVTLASCGTYVAHARATEATETATTETVYTLTGTVLGQATNGNTIVRLQDGNIHELYDYYHEGTKLMFRFEDDNVTEIFEIRN